MSWEGGGYDCVPADVFTKYVVRKKFFFMVAGAPRKSTPWPTVPKIVT